MLNDPAQEIGADSLQDKPVCQYYSNGQLITEKGNEEFP